MAPAPLRLQCSDTQAGQGSGRWTSEREWVYDFARDLPPGVRCSVQAAPGFKSVSGAALAGAVSYQFNTGGPSVTHVLPRTWEEIDEEQFFVLQLNGAATPASVQQHVWCAAEGMGERVPVRRIEGAERAALLKAQGLEQRAAKDPLAFATLACNRRLAPSSKVQLVWGAGVATPSGVANRVEKRFTFTVRAPFSAELRCERENAQAACLPIRPLTLAFSAPVPYRLAAAVRLHATGLALAPQRGEGADDSGEAAPAPDALVERITFAAPLPESTAFTLALPAGFADAAGRPLANAASFPLAVATGAMPPLAKFAAAPFGIVERFAEGPDGPALLPVTLRKVEAALRVQGLQAGPGGQAAAGQVRTLQPASDAEVIAWYRKVQHFDRPLVERVRARREVQGALPPVLPGGDRGQVQTRMLSLLAGQRGARALDLPQPASGDPRPFEVVGIPLAPGFHVVEIASPLLGAALLDAQYGPARSMYVRTTALVTNLGVHFKLGRENALAWVTSLDKGQPVPGARVAVSDCRGRELAHATTDAQGRAMFDGLSPEPPQCDGDGGGSEGYFVSARSAGADGRPDMAFTWSDWQRGIEPWRFNVPTSRDARPDARAHTVFDRMLVRAGETVSMKHLLRQETRQGFGLAAHEPDTLIVTHVGSGQQYAQPLAWRTTATGGRSAHSQFAVPPAAKLGVYEVQLRASADGGRSLASGQFRVEEFRLPVFEGRVGLDGAGGPLVSVRSVPASVQVHYVAGGAAAQLPVRVSALVRSKTLQFAAYDAFSFSAPRGRAQADTAGEEEATAGQDARVIADKLPLTLDRQGAGRVTLADVPRANAAQELLIEASYADPSGEVQTLRSQHTLWPAAVVAGIQAEGWVSARQKLRFQALALNTDGQAAAGVPLSVQAIARTTTTSRKRMVGGFYSYDHHTETNDLGTVCTGQSDARGLLLCETQIDEPGEIELVATARDKAGNTFDAATAVWVTRRGELWFGGENHDRMDLLPEKKSYQPGETARFQVRMPFRFATALVAVEREGILETQVVQLNGRDPTVSLQVQPDWGPNVYVSVLALRGRLREVPWYSFFSWGYKAPRAWWTAFWYEGKEYAAPTALVDLAKPAFRLGMAEIQVGKQAHRLGVTVVADKVSYPVRGKAQITITATLPNGKPAAHAEVALAAVDQALLELMPNTSWNLLDAMLQRRSWGVSTATAQMEIIGRRHFGRKAVPAGGGGGRAPTRELLDTLLLWNPAVKLDANGQARVTVPLNDALTTFQIVAVADAATGLFGTGGTQIRATQDLQILSGLPPLVREGDQFRAQITLRNTTQAAMRVEVAPRATLLELQPQTVDIAARRSARTGLGRDRAGAAGADAPGSAAVGDRSQRQRGRRARCAPGAPAHRARRAAHGAAGRAGAGRWPLQPRGPGARGGAGRQRRDTGRPQDGAAAHAGRRTAGRARLVGALPVQLPGAAGQQGDRPARRHALAHPPGAAAQLPRRRRPGLLLSAAGRRRAPGQRHADRLPAGQRARGRQPRPGLCAARCRARTDGARPDRICRRPHPARVLEPAPRPGPAQARRDRGAVALRQGHAAHARQHHAGAPAVAHARGDRLGPDPPAHAGRAGARPAPGRGPADPAQPPVVPGHEARLQHRAGRPLVVADAGRRREHRAPAARRARRAGLAGRHGAPGQRLHRAPAGRRLADHHGQPLGRAGAAEVFGPVRGHARGRHHRRGDGRPQRPRGLGPGRADARRRTPAARPRCPGSARPPRPASPRTMACSCPGARPAARRRSTWCTRAPASPGSRCSRWPPCRSWRQSHRATPSRAPSPPSSRPTRRCPPASTRAATCCAWRSKWPPARP